MKIKVTGNFLYEGEEYEKGEIVDLPESIARSVIDKGYGEKAEEAIEEKTPPEEIKKAGEGKKPEWKRKVWISEDRNLSISIWPRGGKFDSPSLTLEENRRDDSGNWDSNRIYLPTGSTLVALSEHLKSAWNELQKMKSEENK